MSEVAIVNTLIETKGVNKVLTMTAATEDGAGLTQDFAYTPTGKHSKCVFIIYNDATEKLDVTVQAGTRAFGLAAKATQITNVKGHYLIEVDAGSYMQADGAIVLTIDPNNALKKLLSDHKLTIGVIELI